MHVLNRLELRLWQFRWSSHHLSQLGHAIPAQAYHSKAVSQHLKFKQANRSIAILAPTLIGSALALSIQEAPNDAILPICGNHLGANPHGPINSVPQ
jgi:hypothetical protein